MIPQIAHWPQFPAAIRVHLLERMRDRNIRVDDLNRLRIWLETEPQVPDGP